MNARSAALMRVWHPGPALEPLRHVVIDPYESCRFFLGTTTFAVATPVIRHITDVRMARDVTL
jgi:hypothetical protein